METFADYILAEKDYGRKIEIMHYLKKKTNIFFDNSVIFKSLIAKLFIESMDIDIDENTVVTAMLLCGCKKVNNAQDIEKIKSYAKDGAEFLSKLGFSKEFCTICEQQNRYSNSLPRRKESDILELADNFGGMLLDRPERVAFPIEEALILLESRNLKNCNNMYMNEFKININGVDKIAHIVTRLELENTGIEYHLCRVFKHKGIGKTINIILDNIWLYFRILKAPEKNIWFYNVWTGNLLSYLLIYALSFKKVYILLADYNPARYNRWIGKSILWAIRQAKGVVSLSGRCNEVNHNFSCIPGIIPKSKISKQIGSFHRNKCFLLSGTLNKNTGIELALDVFKNIPDATLFLSGMISDDYKIKLEEICQKYKNIIYKGFFEKHSEYLDLLHSVDFTLSLRDPLSIVNHYNFPSKILETLAYNKIVISTIEYPELNGVNYLCVPYDKEKLTTYIKNLINTDSKNNTTITACLNNTEILIKKYSEEAWYDVFRSMENK